MPIIRRGMNALRWRWRRAKARLRFSAWQVRTRFRSREASQLYKVGNLYCIHPNSIRLAHSKGNTQPSDLARDVPDPPHNERGTIRGGDWDLQTVRFEDLDVWESFQQRFLEGAKWQDTAFYRRRLRIIESGIPRHGCSSRQDLDDRMATVDALFERIRRQGYRTQDEVDEKMSEGLGNEDEIQVHIGRHGDWIFADGRHRLCIAKLLGLERIPVKIARRHRQWVNLRREILAFAAEQKTGRIYAPLTHPDLADIPAHHGSDRMDAIRGNLPHPCQTVLDIGSHWGYFCHHLEELGCTCTAVEDDLKNLYFLRKLKRAQERRFAVVGGDALELDLSEAYDVALALNIFHHFIKKQQLHDQLERFLVRLNARCMFFEPHRPAEPQMRGSYRNYRPEEFVHFIMRHGSFSQSHPLGTMPDGRVLFKLLR